MKLRMYNVGFGDFFAITHGDSCLVCDCGSISKSRKEMNLIVRTAKEELLDAPKTKLALITHFHTDHTSGFMELIEIEKHFFNEVYLPYLTVADRGSNKKVILELAFLMYHILERTSLSYLLAENVIKSIELSLNLTTDGAIRFLSEGETFSVGSQQFRVLWPKKEIEFDKRLIDVLDRLEKDLAPKRLWTLKEEFVNLYGDFVEAANQQKPDNASAIAESIAKVLESASRDTGLHHEDLQNAKKILDEKKNTYALFSRSNNSTSIVFESVDTLAPILMTGDIEKRTVDQIAFTSSRYWAVKAPHHGTDNHFNPNLPVAAFVMISNAKCRRFGKVSIGYQRYGYKLCTCKIDHCESAVPCDLGSCQNHPDFEYIDVSFELTVLNRIEWLPR